jgi:hypothetical protein
MVSTHQPCGALSRCLLECLTAYKTLCWGGMEEQVAKSHLDFIEELHEVANGVIDQDHLDDHNDDQRETPLTGNGVELLAFVVANNLRRPAQYLTEQTLSEIGSFAATVSRLNNPNLSWRLRHSAAVSVELSQLLWWDDIAGCPELFSKGIRQIQQGILEEVLVMLQDNDPDVRCAAGRAAHDIRRLESLSSRGDIYPTVSQCILELTYHHAYSHPGRTISTQELQGYTEHLLQTIIQRCEGFEDKLSLLQEEWKHTESPVALDDLLNTGTERKIFEDEVANPYEEHALADQLSIRSLMGFESVDSSDGIAAACVQLISQCEDALGIIKTRIQGPSSDLLHEVTRSNSVFVALHSLILASTAIVFLGVREATKTQCVQQIAKEILDAVPQDRVHPCIQSALQLLVTAKIGNADTRRQVHDCLFLAHHTSHEST